MVRFDSILHLVMFFVFCAVFWRRADCEVYQIQRMDASALYILYVIDENRETEETSLLVRGFRDEYLR